MNQYSDEQDGRQARRVVVGVDGSAACAHATVWAAEEAAARSIPLTLVHAIDLPGASAWPLEPPEYANHRREDGRLLLEVAADTVRERYPDLTVHTELSELSAARTLSTLSTRAELVVTGTRGHGGFTGMLLGSVSRKLAAHARCPLVVVRVEPATGALDEVVLGLEPGQPEQVIRFAFAAAARHHASLHAVRGWSPASVYTGPTGGFCEDVRSTRAGHIEEMERLLEPLRAAFPEVKVELSVGRGNPVPLLIEAARSARLVVVGSHRHRGPLAVGAGYVVDGLLAHCPTPVAVVPIG